MAGSFSSQRLYYSSCLLAAFLSYGLALGLYGPTLLPVRAQLDVPLATMSVFFTVRAGVSVLGCLIVGTLFTLHRVRAFSGLFAATMLAVFAACWGIPEMRFTSADENFSARAGFMVCLALLGLSPGIMETGGCLVVMHLWRAASDHRATHAALQILHLFFGLGSVAGPALVYVCYRYLGNDDPQMLKTAFGFTAVLNLLVGMAFLPILGFSALENGGKNAEENGAAQWTENEQDGGETQALLMANQNSGVFVAPTRKTFEETDLAEEKADGASLPADRFRLFLVCGFFFAYLGLETTYGAYVDSYAQLQLGLSATTAAAVNSCYWAGFVGSRVVCVIMTSLGRFDSEFLMRNSLKGLGVACVGFLVLSLTTSGAGRPESHQNGGATTSSAAGGSSATASRAHAYSALQLDHTGWIRGSPISLTSAQIISTPTSATSGLFTALSIGFGASLGPLMAAGVQYSEILFGRNTDGKIMMAVISAAAVGEIVVPLLSGWLFATVSRNCFLWLICTLGIGEVLAFGAMQTMKQGVRAPV